MASGMMKGKMMHLLERIFAKESMKKVAQIPDNMASKSIIFRGNMILIFSCYAEGYIIAIPQIPCRQYIFMKTDVCIIIRGKDIQQVPMGKEMGPEPVYIRFAFFHHNMLVEYDLFILIQERFGQGQVGAFSPQA